MRTRLIGLALALVLFGTTALADIVAVPGGGYWLPSPPNSNNAVPTLATQFVNSSTTRAAIVVQVSKTCTLDLVEFNMTVVNNPTVRVSFQDLDATTGMPDGTEDQFRDVTVSGAWVVPGLVTSDGTDGGSKRSVTAGDWLGISFRIESFSAGQSFNLRFFQTSTGSLPIFSSGAWTGNFNGTSWTKTVSAPILALKCSDGSYTPIQSWVYPTTTYTSVAINNGTTPDEAALRFQFPCTTEVSGFWLRADLGQVADLVLYDSASSALVTVSHDPDFRAVTGGQNAAYRFAPTTLTANTTYRLALKPTSASSVTLYRMDLDSNTLMQAVDGGIQWYYSTRTDAGSWSDTTSQRPFMGLLVTGDECGGGGGETSHPFIAERRGRVLPFVARQSRPTLDWTNLLQAAAR